LKLLVKQAWDVVYCQLIMASNFVKFQAVNLLVQSNNSVHYTTVCGIVQYIIYMSYAVAI